MTPLQLLENRVRELVPSLQENWKDSFTEIIHYEIEEIQLQHILQAIEKKGLNDQEEYVNILFKLIYSNNRLWDLTKDASGQSEETLSFLYDIIK